MSAFGHAGGIATCLSTISSYTALPCFPAMAIPTFLVLRLADKDGETSFTQPDPGILALPPTLFFGDMEDPLNCKRI